MPAATLVIPPPSSAGAVHPEPVNGAAADGSAGVAADQPAGTDNLPTNEAWPVPADIELAPVATAGWDAKPGVQPDVPRPPKAGAML